MDLQDLIHIDQTVLLWFNGSDSAITDNVALTLTSAWTWVPLYIALIYLVVKNNGKFMQVLLVLSACAMCLLLADGLADGIVKPWAARLRPSYEPALSEAVRLVKGYKASGYSFFSAHAANTCSLAVFLSLLVRHRVFTVFMVGWSLVNCWTRLYLGVHYPFDIVVGLLWGTVVGFLVYYIYNKVYQMVSPKLHFISTQYTKTGYSLSNIDVVLNVMMLIYTFAVVRAVVIFS